MIEHFQHDPKLDPDPIIDEPHEIRTKLEEKHQGDFHLYSMTARAHAIKLGLEFMDLQVSDKS